MSERNNCDEYTRHTETIWSVATGRCFGENNGRKVGSHGFSSRIIGFCHTNVLCFDSETMAENNAFRTERQRRSGLFLQRFENNCHARKWAGAGCWGVVFPLFVSQGGEIWSARCRKRDTAYGGSVAFVGHQRGKSYRFVASLHRYRAFGVGRIGGCQAQVGRAYLVCECRADDGFNRNREDFALVWLPTSRLCVRARAVCRAWQHSRCLFLFERTALSYRLFRQRCRHDSYFRSGNAAIERQERKGGDCSGIGYIERRENTFLAVSAERFCPHNEGFAVYSRYHRTHL